MANRISTWIYQATSGWLALLALVVFLAFTALVLPRQASQADSQSNKAGSPDLSFYYTPDDLYRMAETYGEVGRAEYVRVRFTFDLVWPLVYGFFLTTSLTWTFQRAFATGSPWWLVNLVPLLGMLFDYLENIATSLVMVRYPEPTPLFAGLAPFFTPVKWILVGGSFVLLIFGLVMALWRWFQSR